MGPYQARTLNVNGEARLLFVTIVGPVRVFHVLMMMMMMSMMMMMMMTMMMMMMINIIIHEAHDADADLQFCHPVG